MYFSDSCQYNIAVSFCPNAMGQNETKTTFCFCRMTARIFNFWKEDLGSDKPSLDFSALLALLSEHEIEIAESTLDSSSEEVSTNIAG